jgi:hypothetical protein
LGDEATSRCSGTVSQFSLTHRAIAAAGFTLFLGLVVLSSHEPMMLKLQGVSAAFLEAEVYLSGVVRMDFPEEVVTAKVFRALSSWIVFGVCRLFYRSGERTGVWRGTLLRRLFLHERSQSTSTHFQ